MELSLSRQRHFLNDELEEEVYVQQPPGFAATGKEHMVLRCSNSTRRSTACGRARQGRGFGKELPRVHVVVIFILIKARQCFIELGLLRIVTYSTFQKIFAQSKIFTLRFDPQRLARLGWVVQRCHARVPRHVPGGHIPKKNRAWLQSRDLPEEQENATPFGSLPRDVGLNEENIGDE